MIEDDSILRQRTNLLSIFVEDERNGNEDDCETSEEPGSTWSAELGVHLVCEEWETCSKGDYQLLRIKPSACNRDEPAPKALRTTVFYENR